MSSFGKGGALDRSDFLKASASGPGGATSPNHITQAERQARARNRPYLQGSGTGTGGQGYGRTYQAARHSVTARRSASVERAKAETGEMASAHQKRKEYAANLFAQTSPRAMTRDNMFGQPVHIRVPATANPHRRAMGAMSDRQGTMGMSDRAAGPQMNSLAKPRSSPGGGRSQSVERPKNRDAGGVVGVLGADRSPMGKAIAQAFATERDLVTSRATKLHAKAARPQAAAHLAYIPPTGFVKQAEDLAAPGHTLKLEHVYGYL